MRVQIVSVLVAVVALYAGRADAAQAPAADDSEKAQVVHQILDVTRAADQVITVIEAAIPTQRAALPAIPAVFWDRLLEQVRQRRGELIDTMVPVWTSTFSLEELKGLLQFYQTPLGKRLLDAQPVLVREAMAAGQRWGSQIGADIGRQLAAEGVKVGP